MTAENTRMSFAELCRSLVEEFAVALVTIKRSHPHDYGLTQLRHLARLEDPKLTEIMADGGNLRVREFRQKALMLKLPPPALPPSNLGEKSLYDLLHLPLDMVQKSFIRPVTRAEVAALYEMLDILNVVVDYRLLRQTPLRVLLDGI